MFQLNKISNSKKYSSNWTSSHLFLLLRIFLLGVTPVACAKFHSGSQERQAQRFAMEPQDQTAIVGSRATLPCRVIDKAGRIQWTKDDFGLGVHRNLSGYERYSMVGSDEEGDFSLDVSPVMLDDDAKYQCQVSPGPDGTPGIRSKFAKLTVLVPPDSPKILQGENHIDHMVTTEDREIELECISYGGKPAPEITWIDGMGNVLTSGIEYFKEPIGNTKRFSAKSILKLIPKMEHHNTTITCQAQNTADRTYKSAKLKLEVKFAPKVTVSVVGGSLSGGKIPEGAEVRLACQAEANPNELSYHWYINGEPAIGDYTTEMIIPNVSRKFHDAIVKCEVQNIVGKSEESETLDISYGPAFRTRPKSVEADIGNEVILNCDVDGNPAPQITWIFDPTEKVVGSSQNVTITVTPDHVGKYSCKASVMGFDEIGADATIYLKGPPSITSTKKQFGIPGDTSRIECIAFSIPKARHIVWSFNGREINSSHDENYSILEELLPYGLKSILIIRDSETKHFGKYNCSVVNEYGHDNVEIELSGQYDSQAIYLIGVVGLIIFIVCIAMISLICIKSGKKKLPPADVIPEHHITEKGCKDSDRYSNNSELKDHDHDYSEYSGTDSTATRMAINILGNGGSGVPLAGPVKIPSDQRYSGDYTDMHVATKIGMTNNGYIPYSEYSRDYSPPNSISQLRTNNTSLKNHLIASSGHSPLINPPVTSSIMNGNIDHYSLGRHRQELRQDNGLPSIPMNTMPNGMINQSLLNNIDPRYSATYGNPYLKNNSNLAPLPTPSTGNSTPLYTSNPGVTPLPPPYVARNNNSNSSFSSSTTISNNGSLLGAGSNVGVNYNQTTNATTPVNSLSQITSPSRQFILPQNGDLKKGALATHV